jgi:hypothetical protein
LCQHLAVNDDPETSLAGVDNESAPSAADIDRIERALGWRPTRFRPATPGRGTPRMAARWIVADDGAARRRTAFVKIGATDLTAEWTRVEHANYRAIHGPFMAEVLGFDDDGDRPVLALEDLSDADWPPPWTDERVAAVLEALAAIHRLRPPDHVGPSVEADEPDWPTIGADPGPFLGLGLCSGRWLEAALPTMAAAAAAAPLAGDALVHLDVRSDNLAFRDGRAIVIDWNHASLANPDSDIAFWLPSLHAEGGPAPETILPTAPEFAAWVAGYFCARAGLPPIPAAPHVRGLQLQQARTALPWAARSLGLPPPTP